MHQQRHGKPLMMMVQIMCLIQTQMLSLTSCQTQSAR